MDAILNLPAVAECELADIQKIYIISKMVDFCFKEFFGQMTRLEICDSKYVVIISVTNGNIHYCFDEAIKPIMCCTNLPQ